MKGKPGRPRKLLPSPDEGHNAGTAGQQRRMSRGDNGGALATPTVVPQPARLLDLHATALYLTVSDWTVRDLEAAGTLSRVRIPLPNNGELRKLLFDRADLDHLIETWKDTTNKTMRNAGQNPEQHPRQGA